MFKHIAISIDELFHTSDISTVCSRTSKNHGFIPITDNTHIVFQRHTGHAPEDNFTEACLHRAGRRVHSQIGFELVGDWELNDGAKRYQINIT